MELAEAYISIRAKPDNAQIKSSITQAATSAGSAAGTQAGKALGQSMQTQVQSVVKSLGTVLGTVGAGLFIKSAFGEATEATRAGAQVEAVLKSTGAAAGVSAEHVDRLATAEQNKVEVDDDVIKRGEAMLLTFRSVNNQLGVGNQIFDRATKAALDMSAVYGGDLQGAIIQVGKALEDPILGLTALRRVGVEFTASQRDQIKALVESGDLLGAQKIILGELEKEFGGAAEKIAKADPFQKFGVDVKNFKETVGKDALPAASGLLGVISNFLDLFGQAPTPIRATTEAVVGLGIATALLSRYASVFGDFRSSLASAAEGEGLLAAASTGLKSALAGIGIAAAGVAILDTIIDNLGKKAPSVERLTKAADAFAQSKIFDGALGESLGGNASKIGEFLTLLDRTSALGKSGSGLNKLAEFVIDPFSGRGSTEINTAKDALSKLDSTLAQLASGGNATEAKQLFDFLNAAAVAQGRSVDDLISHLPGYAAALRDVALQQKAGASSAQDLSDKLQTLASSFFTPTTEKLGVEDAIHSASDALNDLNDARADAEGHGPKSRAAAEDEVSAQRSLADAYKSSAQSVDRLHDAQQKLAEFNSATSQQIRDLERQQITARVVTTPEETRQKRIDLLQFDQSTADKRRDLQNSVRDGEQGVSDATDKVRDAQGKVADAAQKRKQVQVDAAKEIERAENKATEAILNGGTALGQFAKDAEPGDAILRSYLQQLALIATALDPSGELSKRLNSFLGIKAPKPGDPNFIGPVIPPAPKPGDPNFIGPVVPAAAGAHFTYAPTNHFHSNTPTKPELEYQAREFGYMIGRRRG